MKSKRNKSELLQIPSCCWTARWVKLVVPILSGFVDQRWEGERGWFCTHSGWVCKHAQLPLCKQHASVSLPSRKWSCAHLHVACAAWFQMGHGPWIRDPWVKMFLMSETWSKALFSIGFLHHSSSHHRVWRSWVPGPWTPWTGRRWLLKCQSDPDRRSKQDFESTLQHSGWLCSIWNRLLPKEPSSQI